MTHQIVVQNMQGTLKVENVNYTYDSYEHKGAQFTIRFKQESNKN